MTLFIGAELVLAMAIPFLAIAGYHALLDSRAGYFVEEPSESDPGWRALVEPTPVVAVVEMERERLTGIALLVARSDAGRDDVAGTDTGDEGDASQGGASQGGTVILVPGTLWIDGAPLDGRTPDEAVTALGQALRLGVSGTVVVDEERWS